MKKCPAINNTFSKLHFFFTIFNYVYYLLPLIHELFQDWQEIKRPAGEILRQPEGHDKVVQDLK